MGRQIFNIILVGAFGRGALQPLTAAYRRLLLAVAASTVVAGVLSASLWKAQFLQGLSELWLMTLFAVIAFALTSLLLLAIGSVDDSNHQEPYRPLKVLPLRRPVLWAVQVLPQALVWMMLLLFMLPITVALSHASGLSQERAIVSVLFGSLAGLGYVLFISTLPVAGRVLIFTGFAAVALWALEKSLGGDGMKASLLYGVLTGLLICYGGFWRSYLQTGRVCAVKNEGAPLLLWSAKSIGRTWLFAKVFRNPRTANSLVFCLTVAALFALAIHLRRLGGAGQNGWLLFTAVLSGAFACDIRGLARRYKPPEIVALKGVLWFVLHEFMSVQLAGIIIGLPIVLVIGLSPAGFGAQLLLNFIAMQLFANAAGLLSSTFFAPQSGDTGAQFFSAVLATTMIIAFPRLTHLGSVNVIQQAVLWTAGAIGTLVLSVFIEQVRRNNYGRA